MTIECTKYVQINKGTCLGLATIFIPKWGIEINSISLHQKDGKRWVNFPSRSYEKDGVTKYAPYFRFKENDHYTKFCEAVKKAIETHAYNQELYASEGSIF